MTQKLSIHKIILLALFGFVFINAIHAIIDTLIYFYFHYGLSDRFLDIHFQYYVPAFAFSITFIISVIIILLFLKKQKTIKLERLKLPWFLFTISLIIAIALKPIIRKVSDDRIMLLFEDLSKSQYLGKRNLNLIYDTIHYSGIGSQWLLFLLLFISFLYLNKKHNNSIHRNRI